MPTYDGIGSSVMCSSATFLGWRHRRPTPASSGWRYSQYARDICIQSYWK